MRIVIDYQGAQSAGSRNRGIGNYSTALTKAIISNSEKHDVVLVLNGSFEESVREIQEEYFGILPIGNIKIFYIKNIQETKKSCKWTNSVNTEIYNAFINRLSPDVFLITSLFESSDDSTMSNVMYSSSKCIVGVLLYDLIPLVYKDIYLTDKLVEKHYLQRLNNLRHADIVFTISESTKNDAFDWGDISEEQLCNISTAIDPDFSVIEDKTVTSGQVAEKFLIQGEYMMYTGGIDFRKNLKALIAAYGLLPDVLRTRFQLVIVCAITKEQTKEYEGISIESGIPVDRIIFTDYVSNDELKCLYSNAFLFIFPSWHEGFGLPILEAMEFDIPVIGSDCTSIKEIIDLPEALFNPHDSLEISSLICDLCEDVELYERIRENGRIQRKRFSWGITSATLLDRFVQIYRDSNCVKERAVDLPRMAFVAPMPPIRSGIADYSAQLIPALSKHYSIDVIVDQVEIDDTSVLSCCGIRSKKYFLENHTTYDRILYHVGNSVYHHYILDLLNKVTGIVVLHDFYLGGLLSHMCNSRVGAGPDGLWEYLLYRNSGYSLVLDFISDLDMVRIANENPLCITSLQLARQVIVHSQTTKTDLEKIYPGPLSKRSRVVPLVRKSKRKMSKSTAKQRLGLDPNRIIIASFGIVSNVKAHDRILESVIALNELDRKKLQLIFVGADANMWEGCDDSIGKDLLKENFKITGWVSNEEYHMYLSACDIAIQLRVGDRGETSAAVLDCISYGIPTIVNRIGALNDFPDNCVQKIEHSFTNSELGKTLINLIKDENEQQRLSETSLLYADRSRPLKCANLYYDVIEEAYCGNELGMFGVCDKISRMEGAPVCDRSYLDVMDSIISNFRKNVFFPSMYVDITFLYATDFSRKSQAMSLLREIFILESLSFRIEPVYYIDSECTYFYSTKTCFEALGVPSDAVIDECIDISDEDIWVFDRRDGSRIECMGELKSRSNKLSIIELREIGKVLGKNSSSRKLAKSLKSLMTLA